MDGLSSMRSRELICRPFFPPRAPWYGEITLHVICTYLGHCLTQFLATEGRLTQFDGAGKPANLPDISRNVTFFAITVHKKAQIRW